MPGWNRADVYALHMESWEGRKYEYAPMVQFREAPSRGRFVNVSEHGFREGGQKNPWPPDPRRASIFVFGGSTIFGYGIPDNETVPSNLQTILAGQDREIAVYNFGRAYYFSTHEMLLFEKLLLSGIRPDVAVFVDGLNDFYHRDTDFIWTDRLKRLSEGNSFTIGNASKYLLEQLPAHELMRFALSRLTSAQTDRRHQARENVARIVESGRSDLADKVLKRYQRNQKIVRALAGTGSIRTLFVWQPVPMYGYDLKHHLFAYREMGDHKSATAGYAAARRQFEAGAFGTDFLWCADIQKDEKRALYVDAVHYNPVLSRKFAGCIADRLQSIVQPRTP
jgi:hypothetical protein